MAISNEQYQEALAMIAERDKQSVTDAIEIITDVCTDLQGAFDRISELRSTLPAASTAATTSTARSQVENAFNQIQSFSQQAGYMKTSFQSILSQYDNAGNINAGMYANAQAPAA